MAEIKPPDFKIGGEDNSGETIVRIYYQSRTHVIYRTNHSFETDFDEDQPELMSLYGRSVLLYPHLSRVYTLLDEKLSKTEPINRQIGKAAALNFLGATDKALVMLHDAEHRLRRLKVLKGRLQYTVSALVTFTLVLLYDWLISDGSCEGKASLHVMYADVATCGAIGGFLSVMIGFRKMQIEMDASPTLNGLTGVSRILIAMAGAIFAYFLVESGLALTPIADANNVFAIYTIAVFAGFSERFVPNAMQNLSQGNNPGPNPPPPPPPLGPASSGGQPGPTPGNGQAGPQGDAGKPSPEPGKPA